MPSVSSSPYRSGLRELELRRGVEELWRGLFSEGMFVPPEAVKLCALPLPCLACHPAASSPWLVSKLPGLMLQALV